MVYDGFCSENEGTWPAALERARLAFLHESLAYALLFGLNLKAQRLKVIDFCKVAAPANWR